MMSLTVTSELDRVIWAFPSRLRDLICKPDEARRLAEVTRESAREAQAWDRAGGAKTILTGESRGALVKSWDGRVNVRLASIVDRESIPYEFAFLLADLLEARAVEAEAQITINWNIRGVN